MMPATLSIITNTFAAHERGRAIGTWAGVSAMALAIGPVVGGLLVQDVSWQSIFFLNVPVAALAIVVTLFAARESRDETAGRTVDLPGVATLTIGLASLVLGLVQSNTGDWGSARVIALFAVAVVALAAFAAIELRRRAPMVDFGFFRSRSFLGANIVAFIVSFAMLAMFFFLALYMQDILGYSPLQAGLRFLPSTGLIMVVAPIAGRLADRVGPRPLMTGGLVSVAAAMFLLTRITVHADYGMLRRQPRADGRRDRLRDVPDEHRRDELRRPHQGRRGLGHPLDDPQVGGTFGVAVMGAIIATLGRSRLATLLPHASAAQRTGYVDALGAGSSPSGGAGHPAYVQAALSHTYVYALSNAVYVAGGLALLGALVAWTLVSPHVRATAPDGRAADMRQQPERSAEPAPVEAIHA